MSPAFAAKLTRHRAFEIGPRECARFAACVTKALGRHQHEHVRSAAADVLAFAAMALCLESRFALRHVANFAAIAAAFEFHGWDPPNKIILARYSGRQAPRFTVGAQSRRAPANDVVSAAPQK